MRPGQQNKRMRGRGRRGPSPLTRNYESNGPDVKVRGTAAHVAEKYMQLARDAHASGDPVMAENYLQHAEHYFRIIAAAQQSQQQSGSEAQPQRYNGGGRYDSGPDEGDEGEQPAAQQPAQPSRDGEEQSEANEAAESGQAKGADEQAPADQVAEQPAPAPRRRRRRSPSKDDSAAAPGKGTDGTASSASDGEGTRQGNATSDTAGAEDVNV